MEGPRARRCMMKLKKIMVVQLIFGWVAASLGVLYMAATKQLPWVAPLICISIFAFLTYSILKVWRQSK
jgi:ABC-type Mn2+/Zn2+ transport system permease subunit